MVTFWIENSLRLRVLFGLSQFQMPFRKYVAGAWPCIFALSYSIRFADSTATVGLGYESTPNHVGGGFRPRFGHG